MKTLEWTGCFDDSWKGIISPESFAHPAKFARGLVGRIVDYGLQEGFWRVGDLLGDPFGGVALGGVVAAYAGLRWVGVELEEKFVGWGRANIERHRRKWETLGVPAPELLMGDSRNFAALVGEAAGIVTSPPYAEALGESRASRGPGQTSIRDPRANGKKDTAASCSSLADYGSAPGQIGSLPAGTVDAVLTSPPYVSGGRHADQTGAWNANGRGQGMTKDEANYGSTDGQIGRLKEGALEGVVTSPPFDGSVGHASMGHPEKDPRRGGLMKFCTTGARPGDERYGESDGQIGNISGETYWQAMKAVYGQCFAAVKPGGVVAVNVKDYVRNRERVSLCGQTAQLLEHVGFDVFLRVHALLAKTTSHADLFGEQIVKTKARKSFFRRLAEKKGAPAIDYEEVIFARKPSLPTNP